METSETGVPLISNNLVVNAFVMMMMLERVMDAGLPALWHKRLARSVSEAAAPANGRIGKNSDGFHVAEGIETIGIRFANLEDLLGGHQLETAFGGDMLADPASIAVDAQNRFIYVVDTQSDVVDVFDADSYKFLRKIGTPGKKHTLTAPGTFSLPIGVAVAPPGK